MPNKKSSTMHFIFFYYYTTVKILAHLLALSFSEPSSTGNTILWLAYLMKSSVRKGCNNDVKLLLFFVKFSDAILKDLDHWILKNILLLPIP